MPCIAVLMPPPQTYTGEPMLEVQLPGNPFLVERLIELIHRIAADASLPLRKAEPGEFTRRAFLSGRIDLAEAEGIAATISALSDAQLRAATLLRRGQLGNLIHAVTDQLADALARVEAGVDFIDQEDVVSITAHDLHDRLHGIRQTLGDLLNRSRSWSAVDALPWVVLIGLPNAGKSTLFNALLGQQRAITSETAGTTRDVLAEPWELPTPYGTTEVMLADVAGLAAARSSLDQSMQYAAREAIARAEMILCLADPSQRFADPPMGGVPVLHVRTKVDQLGAAETIESPTPESLAVSAHRGDGLDELRRRIAQHVADRAASLSGQMLVLRTRHIDSLRAAAEDLDTSLDMLSAHRDESSIDDAEMIASLMHAALGSLGRIVGVMAPDDLLDRVFARFCIGK